MTRPFARFDFRATAPVDADRYQDFVATAPFRTVVEYDYPYPVDEVWKVISGDRMWSWLPTCWGPRYPAGETRPGVVRDWQMYIHHWLIYAQRERILHWDPQQRLVYTVDDATLPFFGSWLEEYVVEPIDGGAGTRLRWTWAMKLRHIGWLPLRWLSPVLQPVFAFGLKALVRELESSPTGARPRQAQPLPSKKA